MAATRTARRGYGNTAEVAAYTGYSPKTLRNKRARGEGPKFTGTRTGIRYAWADVDAWMNDPNRT